jgi:hypothetical protein
MRVFCAPLVREFIEVSAMAQTLALVMNDHLSELVWGSQDAKLGSSAWRESLRYL